VKECPSLTSKVDCSPTQHILDTSSEYRDCVYLEGDDKSTFRYETMSFVGHFCMPEADFTSSTNMENAFKSAFFNQLLGNKWASYAYDIYKAWWIILVSVVVAWGFATAFLYLIKKFGGIMLWVSFVMTGCIFFVLGFYAFFSASK